MHAVIAIADALAKIAASPFAVAIAGGFVGYLAAGRGERATLREGRRRKELEFQATLRALLIEMLRTAELALSGAGTVPSWGDPSRKTPEEREATARAYEGKIPFPSSKYFRDRLWLKYEDTFIENLDLETIYTVDTAYNGARQTFDMMGSPLLPGATLLAPQLPYLLWRVASDFSKAIPAVSDLRNAQDNVYLATQRRAKHSRGS